jgi:hypothetical protein
MYVRLRTLLTLLLLSFAYEASIGGQKFSCCCTRVVLLPDLL